MKPEGNGGASENRTVAEMEMSAAELMLMNVIGEGIPKIEAASMGARVKRLVEAIPERYKCSTEEGYAMLADHTAALIRDAIPLIESCDSRGLERRIADFTRAATVAASMTEPQPMRPASGNASPVRLELGRGGMFKDGAFHANAWRKTGRHGRFDR